MVKISLAAARVNANMTQAQAAERLNINKATLVNWEKGKSKISFEKLMNLCKLYDIPVDFISVPERLTKS